MHEVKTLKGRQGRVGRALKKINKAAGVQTPITAEKKIQVTKILDDLGVPIATLGSAKISKGIVALLVQTKRVF
jgi:predicted glycosyltransferase